MKRTSLVVTYRYDENELIQCSVSIPGSYPDAVAEAKATLLSMMRETLADVIRQNHTTDT